MPAPATAVEFLDLTRRSGVVDERRLEAHIQKLTAAGALPADAGKLASKLVQDGLLTHFQAEQLMQGKWRRFTIGKYKVLEKLGSGGMGNVYLCEHKLMRRRVAVKILPTAKAAEPSSLERFYREARAVAALDHPNIVHAYDIDQDESLHFLVMEYVDGASLQEIVKRSGPLTPARAAHYVQQTALGLEHAHASGLVHRDIKPGNVLVDRTGIVKILDMGLARFFNDTDDILTKKYDENVLGTADYLAPEQAVDSHGVDIRADIYSLGGTFYFMLTGQTPFGDGSVAQKLIWHQTRQPRPVTELRREVPPAMSAVIERMMAKDPNQRYQTPREVAEALTPWTQQAIAPPSETEMPRLCLAATGAVSGDASLAGVSPPPVSRRSWEVSSPAGSQAAPTARPPSVAPETYAQVSRETPTAREPAPPRVAVRPVPPPVDQEDSIPWEKVAAEAGHAHAEAGQPRKRPRRTLAEQTTMLTGSAYAQREQRLLIWIVSVVGVLLIVGLVVAAFATGTVERLLNPPPPAPKYAKEPLKVTQAGDEGDGVFHSVGKALKKAEAGDRILLMDPVHQEILRLDGKNLPADITIEPGPGVKVTWSGVGRFSEPLLYVTSARGLHFRKIHFDGKYQRSKLITLTGRCPGLTFEDVTLEGFKDRGMVIANCSGEEGRPVELLRLTVQAGGKRPETGLWFFVNKNIAEPPGNEHILVKDCHFEGEFQKGGLDFVAPRAASVQLVNTKQ